MTRMDERMEPVTAPERTVDTVTLEIRTLQRQAQQMLLSYAIEIGRRLVEVKAMLAHGQWGEYIKERLGYSQSTANNLMRIFEEYGADQQSLFGGEAKSQSLGNLSYTKALYLLALPADQRESFVEEHDVAAMSTRELEAAIRERDQARRQAEQDRADREAAEQAREKMAQDMALANQRIAQAAQREAELTRELEELKNRPVDVAVQHAEEADIRKARQEAEEASRARVEALERELEAARKEKGKLLEEQRQMGERLKEARQERQDAMDAKKAAREELKQARDELERARKELRASHNKEITQFSVYFDVCQEDFSRMMGILHKFKASGDYQGLAKLAAAGTALLGNMGKQLAPFLEEGAPC